MYNYFVIPGVYIHDNREEIEKGFKQLRWKWEKAKQACINDGGWFDNMFKSIKTLEINVDAMILIDKLPIESLFDPNESHLNEIKFTHYWYEGHLKQHMNKFEKEYLNIQQKLEKQGKQM